MITQPDEKTTCIVCGHAGHMDSFKKGQCSDCQITRSNWSILTRGETLDEQLAMLSANHVYPYYGGTDVR
jgi:hypothetical protein